MEDVDFGLWAEQVRQRRRVKAAELRDQGLTVREIAGRLGVSHPTILEDLKVEQLERSDLDGMTPQQINDARHAGKLAAVMGETIEEEESDDAA